MDSDSPTQQDHDGMQILLVGPRQLTQELATALLNVEQIGGERPVSAALSDAVDVHAVDALQRHLKPHPFSSHRCRKRPIHVHIKELSAANSTATAALVPHGIWDQIVLITTSSEREFTSSEIWERQETRKFLEGSVSQDDILMQRVAIVVAIGRDDDRAPVVVDSSNDAATQQHEPDVVPVDDNRVGVTSHRVVPSANSKATSGGSTEQINPAYRRQISSLVPSFCWHAATRSSPQATARLIQKRCEVAQHIRYPVCSPLLLTQLAVPRKRKAATAAAVDG
jgi:hypothetical protein